MFCFGSWQNLNHFFVYLLFDTPSYYLRGGTSTTATMHIHHTQRGGTREEHDSRTRDRFARYGFHSETKNKENSIEPVGPGRCCWWSQPAWAVLIVPARAISGARELESSQESTTPPQRARESRVLACVHDSLPAAYATLCYCVLSPIRCRTTPWATTNDSPKRDLQHNTAAESGESAPPAKSSLSRVTMYVCPLHTHTHTPRKQTLCFNCYPFTFRRAEQRAAISQKRRSSCRISYPTSVTREQLDSSTPRKALKLGPKTTPKTPPQSELTTARTACSYLSVSARVPSSRRKTEAGWLEARLSLFLTIFLRKIGIGETFNHATAQNVARVLPKSFLTTESYAPEQQGRPFGSPASFRSSLMPKSFARESSGESWSNGGDAWCLM